MTAWDRAQAVGGTFLLRIEDIDQSRARPEWEAAIYDDLAWLGIDWESQVMRQSERTAAYRAALDTLWQAGLLYPCTCTRRDIAEALDAPQESAPMVGPDGVIYPGTCRDRPISGPLATGTALRLNMKKAAEVAGQYVEFAENGLIHGPTTHVIDPLALQDTIGDVVLARRDMGTSYHLSVVVDDAEQRVTEVVRGADLFDATAIHVLLQALLKVPTPTFYHHDLIRDSDGKRLAKRDDARALSVFRDQGLKPEEIRAMVGL